MIDLAKINRSGRHSPDQPPTFYSDWIADAMEHGKMTREEAEDCLDKQEYRDQKD